MLSDSDSEANGDLQLTINEHYAKAYAAKKEREELGKCTSHYVLHLESHKLTSSLPHRSERKIWLRR